MGQFVDFQELKAKITIVQVLEMLEVKHLKPHGNNLRGECPACREGGDRSFVVAPAKNSFYCFSEKKGGDIIELVARMGRQSHRDAAFKIASYFRIGVVGNAKATEPDRDMPPQAHVPTTPGAGFDVKTYQASLDPAHAALKDSGVSEQTIRDFGGGYCSRGLNRGRLVIPVYDEAGAILAFMGLALKGEQPDILWPKGFEPPPLFNTHREGSGTLILVQGPRDVLRTWEADLSDVVCPLATLTPDGLDYLATFMRRRGYDTMEFY